MTGKIRLATLEDAEALLEVYRPFIMVTCISFEYEVPSLEQYRQRIEAISREYPYLVYEKEGRLLGYAYAHRYLERMAYSWDVEVSIYLAPEAQGRGLARLLYQGLEQLLALQQVKNLYACITGDNEHSIGLHQSLGYQLVGTFTRAGFKQGRWLDVVWLEKALEPKEEAPQPLIPFAQLEALQVEQVLALVNQAGA